MVPHMQAVQAGCLGATVLKGGLPTGWVLQLWPGCVSEGNEEQSDREVG